MKKRICTVLLALCVVLGLLMVTAGATSTYTVTYDANGADDRTNTVPIDGNSPYASGATVTVLPRPDKDGYILNKDGYTFYGWNTQADGTGTDYGEGQTFTITKNTTLYAKWILSAVSPVITPGADLTLNEGYAAGSTVGVNVADIKDHTLSYQWYKGGLVGEELKIEEIAGATDSSYEIPTGLAVGTYEYTCIVTATRTSNKQTAQNYETVTVTVNEPVPTYTAPVPINGLVCTGEAQALVTAGSVEGGTMMYAMGADSSNVPTGENVWSTNIPTATDVGTHYVWYKVVGDANHSDSTPACLTVSIVKAYDLWIGGVQVNENNLSGAGWSFVPDTNTLTLNGADVAGVYAGYWANSTPAAAGIYCNGKLNLVLNGSSTVAAAPDNASYMGGLYGIYVAGDLTITGSGSLAVSTAKNAEGSIAAIRATNFVIGSASSTPTVTATGGEAASSEGDTTPWCSRGIEASAMTVNSGTVKATGGTATGTSEGIFLSASNPLLLYNGHIIVTGNTQAVDIARIGPSASGYYRTASDGNFTSVQSGADSGTTILTALNTNTYFEYVSTSHLGYTDKKFKTHDYGCPDTCSLTKVTMTNDESHRYGSDGSCDCGKAKPATAFSGDVVADKSGGVYTYGDTITITVNPVPSGDSDVTFVTGLSEKLSLYFGNTELSAVIAESDGGYSITYSTEEKGIPVGSNTVTVKFAGDDYMSACEGLVNITLNAKELTVSATATNRTYEPDNTTVAVTAALNGGIVESDSVSFNTVTTGTIPSDNADTYTVTLPTFTLTGEHAAWYTVQQPSEAIFVTITKALATDEMTTASGYLIKGSTSTVTLPELPINSGHRNPTFDAPIVSAAVNYGSLTVTGNADVVAGETYTVTIPVIGEDGCNYNDYEITVTLTGTEHSHDWTYTASGDTITAKCNNADTCPDAEQSITIFAVDKTYDGMAVTATVTNTVDSTDYSASVVYEAKTGSLTEGKPVNAGTYTASITLGDVTASVKFTIDKAQLTITPKNYLLVEGSNAPDLTAADAYSVDGLAQGETLSGAVNGTITLSYDKTPDMSEVGHYSIHVNGDALTSDNYEIYCDVGMLEIIACIHQFENFALSVAGDSILATCANDCAEYKDPKGIVTITAPENLVYDPGLSHTVSLMYHAQIELNSEEIVYSADPILPGTYTASIEYGGVTASVTYTVAKRPLTITADDQTVLVGGRPDPTKITAGGDGLADDHTVTVTFKAVDTTTVGTKTLEIDTATIKSGDTDVTANYDITTVNGTLTVIEGYTVMVNPADNGAVTADKTAVAVGETVTLTVTPETGYELESLTVMQGETEVAVNDNKFTMPAGDVTVTAQWKPIKFYIVLRDSLETGAETTYVLATYGQSLDMSEHSFFRPGYTLKSWSSKGDGNGSVNCAANGTIPAKDVNFLFDHAYMDDEGYYCFAYLTAQWEDENINGFYIVLRGSAEGTPDKEYVWAKRGESLAMSEYQNRYSREGYILTGWNSRGDGTGLINCTANGTISAADVETLFGYAYKDANGSYYFSYLTAQWATAYDLWVGGVQVTSANASDVLSDGTVSYNPETNTLTLNHAAIVNENGEGIKAKSDLTIEGTGSITGSTYGVYTDGSLYLSAGTTVELNGETALAVGGGLGTTDVIITDPKAAEQSSVEVDTDVWYTTYGTSDEEANFTPASKIKFEPGYVVSFNVGESMDWIDAQEVVAGGKAVKPADPTRSGYRFDGWYTSEDWGETLDAEYDFETPVADDVELYAKWDVIYYEPYIPTTTTTTTKNEDGSTTTTKTNNITGTVTETTKNTDGSTTVVETKRDGTVTTTNTGTTTETAQDGTTTTTDSTVTETVAKDGTSTMTATTQTKTETADGSTETVKVEQTVVKGENTISATTTTTTETAEKTETVEVKSETVMAADGTETTTTTTQTKTETADGSTATTTQTADGTVTAEVAISEEAAAAASEAGEAVTLPIPAVEVSASTETAPTVTVTTGNSEAVTVEVPVSDVTPGTVVVIVNADGTETVVTKTGLTETGVTVTLEGDATVKVVDNAKTFTDVGADDWHSDAVDFVSARELYNGVGNDLFDPEGDMSRGMLATVLHNLEDNPAHTHDDPFHDVHDHHWYEESVHWAAQMGYVEGYPDGSFRGENAIIRQDMVVLLWRYAGSPESDHDISHFADAGAVSAYAEAAVCWANEHGILNGMNGLLNPHGTATRAQVAQLLKNYIENML